MPHSGWEKGLVCLFDLGSTEQPNPGKTQAVENGNRRNAAVFQNKKVRTPHVPSSETATPHFDPKVKSERQTPISGPEILFGPPPSSTSCIASVRTQETSQQKTMSTTSDTKAPASTIGTSELEPLMVTWLDTLGISSARVKETFRRHNIDCKRLATMSNEELRALGIEQVFEKHLASALYFC